MQARQSVCGAVEGSRACGAGAAREDGERAGESAELKPVPLGEEPVVAGVRGGDDGGGFGGREGLERWRRGERGGGEEREGESCGWRRRVRRENEDEGERVGGHQRMQERGEEQAEAAAE